jgi:CDP-diacylglycerol--glycerol-3-phosphate 3-phosphatidyltransferase
LQVVPRLALLIGIQKKIDSPIQGPEASRERKPTLACGRNVQPTAKACTMALDASNASVPAAGNESAKIEGLATQEKWLNAPNIITISRLVLSAVLFALISLWQGDSCGIAAAILFAVATLTDALDGYLARKYNLITQLGRILDPFADKIIVLGTFIFLLERAPLSGVNAAMIVLILAREMLVTGLRSFLEQHGKDFSASWIGKVKMVIQSVALVMSLLSLSSAFRADAFLITRDIFLWSAVAITLYSGWIYLQRALQLVSR